MVMPADPATKVAFDIRLDDGRVARCWQATAQPYLGYTISAGLVRGIEPDCFYLRFERDGDEPLTIFMREDEVAAVLHVCSGALWSATIIPEDFF